MDMVLLLQASIKEAVIATKLEEYKNIVMGFGKRKSNLEGKVKVSKRKIRVEFLEVWLSKEDVKQQRDWIRNGEKDSS